MNDLISLLSSGIGLLIGVAIWAILFVVILEVLKKASPFSGWATYVIAVCVSLLSVIGMHRMLAGAPSHSPDTDEKDPFGFLLLPYAAMGIAMLIVLLLLFLRRMLPTRREESRRTELSGGTERDPGVDNGLEGDQLHRDRAGSQEGGEW